MARRTSTGLQPRENATPPETGSAPVRQTRAELYQRARALEIPGRSRMTKAQLVAAIQEAEHRSGLSPVETLAALGRKAASPVAPAAAKSVEVAKSLVREAQAFVASAHEVGATALERVRSSD